MAEKAAVVCKEVLQGLDDDVLEYISGVVLDDDQILPKEELVEVVAPLLVSSEFVSDEAEAEAVATRLWDALHNAEGVNKEKKPDVVLLKNAVLMGGKEPEEESVAKLVDPMLKRRGGNAFACATQEEEIDVHSKAAIAKARLDAKAEAKRQAAKQEHERQMLAMEEELEQARRSVALSRIAGDAAGEISVVESECFDLPNPGGGENLLEDANIRLVSGHRYGLIGRNGKGKSTLLRWIAARRVKGFPSLMSMHYVAQEIPLAAINEGIHPVDMVLKADIERELLLERQKTLERDAMSDGGTSHESALKLADVVERLMAIDADGSEGRARAMLVSLGFSEELLSRPMKALSGGWRVRVALAAALFAKPDILLLDEPTNHLSIDGVLWLQRTLATSTVWKSRIVVVVSHDRMFLDAVCTDMLHISGIARRLTHHKGNYNEYEERRKEMQATYAKSAELREKRREKLLERRRRRRRMSRMMRMMIMMRRMRVLRIEGLIMLSEAEKEEDEFAFLEEDQELELSIKGGGVLPLPIARFYNVSFGYPVTSSPLFQGVEMCIDAKSRVCLLGENGVGKTTLVKILMNLLEPTSGVVERDLGARIALVNQHHADQIDLNLTPLHWMHSQFPGDGSYQHEQELRKQLAQCGVTSELQTTRASCLSGGQRSRVALAAVSYTKPHLLIMDEPTNNLDIESVDALSEAVLNFDGGVVLVSHDQTFVSAVAKEVWVLGGGVLKKEESFEAYRKKIMKQLKE
ncbi:hypothetical protein GUITHDRAFT_88450 [Guillardia theta CCMP2712]|uniref:ABC transporter domain-containing protein n=1 Tax=Guillardia theta (strain CCMP2712) TaxID=905079 RepID=L1IYQ5_GUITC|nr:hypothetical protein GUITHDRAFT_88450 [Guillardia theta CCMP2712]EKX41356.1 hypothetical protein GUITHDRAFT_88450 [Guillardia theta CCMP2712]|eukprot:XP_005828336.1 hypothetical protein GUITHDRAFT_88450 [Guillardia theta CCMP2712]